MARARFTPEQRQEAIGLAVEHGPAEASRRTGIAQGTIGSWCHRAGVATVASATTAAATEAAKARRETRREELRGKLLDKALDMLDRMDEAQVDFRGKDATEVTWSKATSSACQQYATAAAILVDKFRLEVGEATERRAVTDDRTDVLADAGNRSLRLVG